MGKRTRETQTQTHLLPIDRPLPLIYRGYRRKHKIQNPIDERHVRAEQLDDGLAREEREGADDGFREEVFPAEWCVVAGCWWDWVGGVGLSEVWLRSVGTVSTVLEELTARVAKTSFERQITVEEIRKRQSDDKKSDKKKRKKTRTVDPHPGTASSASPPSPNPPGSLARSALSSSSSPCARGGSGGMLRNANNKLIVSVVLSFCSSFPSPLHALSVGRNEE